MGQVDYDATPNELQSHFEACGTINRVTILCDKFSGRPKGYAYIEFADGEGAINALSLDNSPFKGRNLKVMRRQENLVVDGLFPFFVLFPVFLALCLLYASVG